MKDCSTTHRFCSAAIWVTRNSHDPRNLPIFLAGGGYQHGRYVSHDAAGDTPLCNLFVTMLGKLGLEVDAFGQSTGELTW